MIAAALRGLERYWFSPAPARRLATLRVLTGAFCTIYLVSRMRALAHFEHLASSSFEPVGAARWLSQPLASAWVWSAWSLCFLLSVAFTLGFRFRITGPAFAAMLLWVTSYRSSWGMVFHTENLLVLHVFVLALSAADAELSHGKPNAKAPAQDARFGWPIRLLCALTVCTYLVAGVAKLRFSGLAWIDGDVLRGHLAFDAVRKIHVGSIHSPLGLWMARTPWVSDLLSPFTLLVELGAPLALLSRRLGLGWAWAVWAFHLGVLLSMAIAFPYPLCGIGLASFTRAERIWNWPGFSRVERWLSRGSPGACLHAAAETDTVTTR
jgi:hypothetical protein